MILASTAGAMGMPTKVFVTFWGLQTFVKAGHPDHRRELDAEDAERMQRPGIAHRKLSQMNFLGMGPWMMRKLAGQYGVASPKPSCSRRPRLMGVEFIPCQMTMDMFGLKRERPDRRHGRARRRRHRTSAASPTAPRRCSSDARPERTTRHDRDRPPPVPTVVIDARGSFCPGPLMELIRGIREAEVGDVIAVLLHRQGQPHRHPEVGREGRPHPGRRRSLATASTRSSSRRRGRPMQRVVILGGGVGGTLAANLIARKLTTPIAARRGRGHGRRRDRHATPTSRATCTSRWAASAPRSSSAGALPARRQRQPRGRRASAASTPPPRRRPRVAAQRCATTTWSSRRGRGSCPRRSSTSSRRRTTSTRPRRRARLRSALDAFTGGRIVIGIAGIPYKCPPAPLEVAFLDRVRAPRARPARADRAHVPARPINRAFTIESVSRHGDADPRGEGDPARAARGVAEIDPERKVAITDAFEEHPYDLLIVRAAAQGRAGPDRLGPGAGVAAGCRPTATRSR